MNRSILLTLILLFALAATAAGGSDKEAAADAIEWDFGFVCQKAEVGHTFYVANQSPQPVAITKIKAGCSCTTVEPSRDTIPPGDSVGIEVIFKSGRYQGKTRKTSHVYLDGSEEPAIDLIINARVYKKAKELDWLSVEPQKLDWRLGDDPAAGPEYFVKLGAETEGPLTVRTVYAPPSLSIPGMPRELRPSSAGTFSLKPEFDTAPAGDGHHVTFDLVGADDSVRVTVPIVFHD